MKRIMTLIVAIAAVAVPATASAATHSCGNGITAGESASCAIAYNAQSVWRRDSHGSTYGTGWLYSPATGRDYTVTWTMARNGRVTCLIHGIHNPWVKFWA